MKGIKKMLIVKKSSIITLCLICVLVVAGYLNYMNKKTNLTDVLSVNTQNEESYFEMLEPENYGEAKFVGATAEGADFKFERDKKKSEIIALYREISENPTAREEDKVTATAAMLKLAKESETETNIESLISAKGFSEPTAIISGDGISVFLKKDNLSKTEIAVIRDIVMAESNLTSDKIRIKLK